MLKNGFGYGKTLMRLIARLRWLRTWLVCIISALLLVSEAAASICPFTGIYVARYINQTDTGGFMSYVATNGNGITIGYSSIFHEGLFSGFSLNGYGNATGTNFWFSISEDTISGLYTNGANVGGFVGSVKNNTGPQQTIDGVYSGNFSGVNNYGDTISGSAVIILAADGAFFYYTYPTGGTFFYYSGPDGGLGVLNAQNQMVGFASINGASANGSVSPATGIWSGSWSQSAYIYPYTFNFVGTFSLSRYTYFPLGIFPLISTASTLPSANVGVLSSHTLQASGGTTPYNWSVTAGSLPSGLALNSAGVIGGTPNTSGSYNFTIRCTGADSLHGAQAFSMVINPAVAATITVHGNPSNGGTVSGSGSYNVGSSQQISASANSGWTFTGWSDGNTQNPRSIAVLAAGATYTANFAQQAATITVQANPSNGGTVNGSGTYNVGTAQQISAIANSGWTFAGWSDGLAQTHNITVLAAGATYTANFVVATSTVATPTITPSFGMFSNSLVVTLSCSTAGAAIRYTSDASDPTSSSTAYKNKAITLTNSVTLKVKAFKGSDSSVTATAAFTIIPPVPLTITTTSLPDGQFKVRYPGATVEATGGVAPYKWALLSGNKLPAGLTLNATTGVIAGKPTKAGPFSFTVKVTDAKKQFVTQALTLTVN